MDATQIILIVFIVILIIVYPILISVRNKKENQKIQEQTNSLKRGDKIITTSGVYGTIVDLHLEDSKKIVTIETGTGKNKGYVSIDAYSIYTIIKDEEPVSANTTDSAIATSQQKLKSDDKSAVSKVEQSPKEEEKPKKVKKDKEKKD